MQKSLVKVKEILKTDMALNTKEIYRFEGFLVDPAERLLWDGREPVSMPPKAFDTLVYMVRNPGRLLSKDELLKELWPDTFVEEVNLAVHVSTLRKVLGDSTQEPKFIETVAGRGYRFVCGVERVEEAAGEELPSGAGVETGVAAKETPTHQQANGEMPRAGSSWKIWMAWTVGLVILGYLAGGYWVRHKRVKVSSAVLTQKDLVLLGDFENTTGEAVFDGALKDALAVDLEQSPFLRVNSNEREREALTFMGRAADQKVGGDLLPEVCQRVQAKALVRGSIARVAEKYLLTLEAVSCESAEELGREQIEARNKDEVIPRMGEAATKFRAKLGESLSSVEQFDVPLEKATTSSLEALKSYSLGVAQRREGKEKEAIPFFVHALELDPHFAMANGQLGTVYGNLGETEKAAGYLRQAYAEKEKLSEREKLYLTVKYHTLVTGDITKATETYEVWSKLYPRDWSPFNGLSARYQVSGQYEKALAAAREAVRLEPNHYLPYANLASSYMSLSRFEEAEATCRKAQEVHRESYYTHHALFELALLRNDAGTMERELRWSRDAGRENDMLSTQGFALMAQGKVAEARKYFARSWEESKVRGLLDNVAYSRAGVALAEADFGEYKEARNDAQAALHAGRGIDAEEVAAEALAIAGDVEKSRELTEDRCTWR